MKSHIARQAMCVNINSCMGSTIVWVCNMKQDESEVIFPSFTSKLFNTSES